tara:strand:- start:2298 stop:2483 length:186 start_codon:yes stop_codon:yes gene_type:complete
MYNEKKIIEKTHYQKMYNEVKKEVLQDIIREGVLKFLKVDDNRLGKEFDREIQKTIMENRF